MSKPPSSHLKTSSKIQKYWDGLKENRILTTTCGCGEIHWPPRAFCPSCYSDGLTWIELPTEGKLVSSTRVFTPADGFSGEYTLALVELPLPAETKPVVRVLGRLLDSSKSHVPGGSYVITVNTGSDMLIFTQKG